MAWMENEDKSSVQKLFQEFYDRNKIEEQCTTEDLKKLRAAFSDADSQAMDESRLRKAFYDILNIDIPEDEFHILFTRIDLKRHGFVTWDQMTSHLLLEFREKDKSLQWQSLEPPFTGLSEIKKTHHRCPILRITFCPEVRPNRSWDPTQGYYITASRDGVMNYWSSNLEHERSVRSTNRNYTRQQLLNIFYKMRTFLAYLKASPTIITDVVALPDIQMICTSSTERDLRFYDTAAGKFNMRIMMSSFEHPVVCMNYYFSADITDHSHIILGDTSGTVKVMSFSPVEKGPFRFAPERDFMHLRYEAVAKGEFKGLKVTEFKNIHANWVRQVRYYGCIRIFISCALCSERSLYVSDIIGTRMQYKFNVVKGISCFDYSPDAHRIVTGGPDCIVRVWNPVVPEKPNVVFEGHRAPICALVIQKSGKRIYSISKDKCIKAWDIGSQTCIQTYNQLPSKLSGHIPMSILHNSISQQIIIANTMIIVLDCERVIDAENSDGYTHSKAVTCVLYNNLFKVIVTTGSDSCIIVWNPWLGRRLYLIRNAHEKLMFGQLIAVEITSACFDTAEQLLATGARDGTIKIWDFNSRICIMHMNIERNCEVTSIMWIENRILCTGWNRRVTEFVRAERGIHKKNWTTRHSGDILCSAVNFPQTLATASNNGELILWRLETGQPYRRYQVNDPTERYALHYEKKAEERLASLADQYNRGNRTNKSVKSKVSIQESSGHGCSKTYIQEKSALSNTIRTVGVYAMIFLKTRPVAPDIASLLVSLEDGIIQAWTHHPAAGFLTSFSVNHISGDYATSLTTDPANEFLITGHTAGYIKVWLLSNFVYPAAPNPSLPLLRLQFPFLWKDRIQKRAKKAVQNQPVPLLLSSVLAHCKVITSLQFVPGAKLIISGSSDHTVRLWTLSGRYISTLSELKNWSPLLPDTPVEKYCIEFRLPPDIKKIGSYTTMKVLNGGQTEVQKKDQTDDRNILQEVSEEERHMVYGSRLTSPRLGHRYKVSSCSNAYAAPPILDSSLAYIPVYTHLVTHELAPIKRPPTPSLLLQTRSVSL